MGMFSNIFGGSERGREKHKLKEIERQTAPIYELGKCVITAAAWCADQVKDCVEDDAEKVHRRVYVHFEFLYFFMHLTNRAAFRILGHERRTRLQEELGPAIVHGAIEVHFEHWPVEMKRKMELDLFKKLDDAEVEYSSCQGLYSSDQPFTSNTLCTRLARNVAELAGKPENPVTMTIAMDIAMTAFKEMNLDKLVEEIGTMA